MKTITYVESVLLEQYVYPKSYVDFVQKYGYGTYCGLLNIAKPDQELIYSTFAEYDFWDFGSDFDSSFEKSDLKKAVQIASTIDGDILCFVEGKQQHLFILPRSSEVILTFETLEEVLSFYNESYKLTDIYFEPNNNRKIELFSLVDKGQLLDINILHNLFLDIFKYDFVIGNEDEQPKYVIEQIGGWIKFDLIYKNSITISYQETSSKGHLQYFDFIEKELERLRQI